MKVHNTIGYRVHAEKHPTRNEWSPSGEIFFLHRGDVPVQKFDSLGDDLYPTKEEAIQAGASILRDKIDAAISKGHG